MVVLIAGGTHTGKTLLAQRLLEKYGYPYLSIDHLKMGLIRSGQTALTPQDDGPLTDLLWPILREMIKTAVENKQKLIVEGCYIPFGWREDFSPGYLEHIRYHCLIMTEGYITARISHIRAYARAIEARPDDSCPTPEELIRENSKNLELCRRYGHRYLLIDGEYDVDIEL